MGIGNLSFIGLKALEHAKKGLKTHCRGIHGASRETDRKRYGPSRRTGHITVKCLLADVREGLHEGLHANHAC